MTCCCANKCNVCPNFNVSTSVALNVTNTIVTISLPALTVNDGQKYCMLVAQNLPVGSEGLPVQVATGGNTFNLVDRCGDYVRADQLRTRRVYNLRATTTPQNFVLTGGCLCKGTFVQPSIAPVLGE